MKGGDENGGEKKIKERDEKKDDHDGGWGRLWDSFLRGYLQGDRVK